MRFAEIIYCKRKELNFTQQDLADRLHITRQTLSRWENEQSYPNLDTLIQLSEILDLPLDYLLKGENNQVANEISRDVKSKKRYKMTLVYMLSVILCFLVFLTILGYGRVHQNSTIDRLNPFLKMKTGYAILPNPNKDNFNKRINVLVSNNPFGNDGEWLKIYSGAYNNKNRWVITQHKGSYIKSIRLISNAQIPVDMQEQAGRYYVNKDIKEPTLLKNVPWSPFD